MAYIELEALLKYPIRIDHYDKEHGKLDFVLGIESVLEYAEALPAADVVEVVHGRWERMVGAMPPEYHGRHKCSCCGAKALDWKFYEKLSDYCPQCGAKMDGESNE